MKSRLDAPFFWFLAMALVVVAFLVDGRAFPPQVRIVPYLVGITTLVLLVILLLGNFYPAVTRWTESTLEDLWGGVRDAAGTRPPQEAPPWSGVFRIAAWIVGFFLSVFLLGIVAVPSFFIAAFLIVEAGVAARKAIPIALAVSFAVCAGMAALQVEFWTGLIPELIPGYLGGAILPPL